jgi:hypothetical protein
MGSGFLKRRRLSPRASCRYCGAVLLLPALTTLFDGQFYCGLCEQAHIAELSQVIAQMQRTLPTYTHKELLYDA